MIAAALIWVLPCKRKQRRRAEAENIRKHAAEQSFDIGQREACADETAAKARGAKAEADAKAAESVRLPQQAHAQHCETADSRDELDQEWERANQIDTDSESRETQQGADSADHQSHPPDIAVPV